MAKGRITVKIEGLERFLKKVERTSGDKLKKEVARWLEASGFQFLDEIQQQIIAMGVVDTRLLLNSFQKGGAENVWHISNGGLTLDIGTRVKYARLVNDGHFTGETRWVPGIWKGDSFEYTPGAETGMLLRAQWIEGRPYWDTALVIFERMFGKSFEKKFEQWVKEVGW